MNKSLIAALLVIAAGALSVQTGTSATLATANPPPAAAAYADGGEGTNLSRLTADKGEAEQVDRATVEAEPSCSGRFGGANNIAA